MPSSQLAAVCLRYGALSALTTLSLLGSPLASAGDALTVSGTPPTTAAVGTAYSFRPNLSDPSGRTVTFKIYNKPSWAAFDTTTGRVYGTPAAANVGTYRWVQIAGSDGVVTSWLPAYTLTVSGTSGSSTKLAISGTPPTTATAGTAYSFKPTVTVPSGQTATFSISNKPSWASFSIANGALSGTPTAANVGTYSNVVISTSTGSASASLPAFSIVVANASSSGTATTLAQKYPGDVGIGSDPSVVWYENFAESSVSAFTSRYDSDTNPAGMALVADHPANSPGQHAIQLTAGGSHTATDFYKSFGSGYDELWFRYYAKYEGTAWHHSGLWFGGYNPSQLWPAPHAGVKPTGSDRFSLGLEPQTDFAGVPMDFYAYWMQMHSWKSDPTGATGDYWGNTLVHDAEFRMQSNAWVCYEVHLKLNPDPTNGSGAVLEVWQNDNLIRRFDDTGPYGYWVKDKFCPADADGTECTNYRPANPVLALLNQQWRSTTALKINYFWPQNYNDASTTSSLLLDDMVVARQRIGCTVPK